MGIRNLALIFGASLLNPPPHETIDLISIKLQCSLIELFLMNYKYIFEGEERDKITLLNLKAVATIPAGNPSTPRSLPPPSPHSSIPTSASSPSLSSNFNPKKKTSSLIKRKHHFPSQSSRAVKSMLNISIHKPAKDKEKDKKKTTLKSFTDKIKKEIRETIDSPRRSSSPFSLPFPFSFSFQFPFPISEHSR